MPRVKLTKSAIDALPTPEKEIVYWDSACPGFGVTPKGRKDALERWGAHVARLLQSAERLVATAQWSQVSMPL